MPREKLAQHKGQSRHFSNPAELQQELVKGTAEYEEIGVIGEEDASLAKEEDKSVFDRHARKGVAALIKIENPNRLVKKATQKVTNFTLDDVAPTNQQIEERKTRRRYMKQQAEGRSTQAQADLARLAVIRQQRNEAAAKRAADKKALEEKKNACCKSW